MRRSGLHLRVGHKAAARTRAATLRALLERANPLAACVPRATLAAASALAGRSWAAMAHDGRCIYRLANADAQRQGQEAREHASQQGRSKHTPQQRREPEQGVPVARAWKAATPGWRAVLVTMYWPAANTSISLAFIRELCESTSSRLTVGPARSHPGGAVQALDADSRWWRGAAYFTCRAKLLPVI